MVEERRYYEYPWIEEEQKEEETYIKYGPMSEKECIEKINDIVWEIIAIIIRFYIELVLGRQTGRVVKGQELLVFPEGKFTREQILLRLSDIQSYRSFIEDNLLSFLRIEDKYLVENAMSLMDSFKDALEKDQIEDIKILIEGPLSGFLPHEIPLTYHEEGAVVYPSSDDIEFELKKFLENL